MYILQNLAYDISFVPFLVSRSYPIVPPPIYEIIPFIQFATLRRLPSGQQKKRLSHFLKNATTPYLPSDSTSMLRNHTTSMIPR